jgi:hypothetical protein
MILSSFLVFFSLMLAFVTLALAFVVFRASTQSENEEVQAPSPRVLGGIFGVRAEAEEACAKLFRKIWELENKREVINSYAPEYFNTLQDAGWQDFIALLSQLNQTQDMLEGYLAGRNYSEALTLAKYILGSFHKKESKHELAIVRQRFPAMIGLENWQQLTNQILVAVTVAVEQAASDTKDLGINRNGRKRKPTLVMISDMVGRLN